MAQLRHEKYVELLDGYGIELRPGRAELDAPHGVTLDGETLSAAAILVAASRVPNTEAEGERLDFAALPRVIFTKPAIASAGLTESQAQEAGFEVESRVLPLDAVPRALVNGDTRGLVRLVAEEGSGRLLGASVVADGAGEVIQAGVLAIELGMTVEELASTGAPYLTMAEGSSSPPRPSPATWPSSPAAPPDDRKGGQVSATPEAPFRLREQPDSSTGPRGARHRRALCRRARRAARGTAAQGLEPLGLPALVRPRRGSPRARTVYYRVADTRVHQIIELLRGLLQDNAEHVATCRTIDEGRC